MSENRCEKEGDATSLVCDPSTVRGDGVEPVGKRCRFSISIRCGIAEFFSPCAEILRRPDAGIEPAIQTRNPARFQELVQSERDGRVMATCPARRNKARTNLGARVSSDEGLHPGVADVEREDRPGMVAQAIGKGRVEGVRNLMQDRDASSRPGHRRPSGRRSCEGVVASWRSPYRRRRGAALPMRTRSRSSPNCDVSSRCRLAPRDCNGSVDDHASRCGYPALDHLEKLLPREGF